LGHTTLEMTRRYTQALGFDDVFKRHVQASHVVRLVKNVGCFICIMSGTAKTEISTTNSILFHRLLIFGTQCLPQQGRSLVLWWHLFRKCKQVLSGSYMEILEDSRGS